MTLASVTRRTDPAVLLYGLLLIVASATTVLRASFGGVRDVDVWWHILIGRDLAAGASVTGVGADWTLADVDAASWVTTQPLAELAFSWLHGTWGMEGLLLVRVVTSVAAVAVVLLTTVRGRSWRAAAWPAVLALTMVAIATQERSQQLTYVLAPIVGLWCWRVLREGRLPRWWVVVPLVVVWANVHGGWVLLPVFLVVAAVGRLLDHGVRDRTAVRAALLAVLATASAAVSPAGLDNITSVLRIRSAAWLIAEWEAVQPWTWLALPLVLLVLVVVVAWARSPEPVPKGEVLLLLAVLAFCFSAWRNVTPGMLLAAPMAAPVLARWLREPESVPPRLSRGTTVAVVAAGCTVALVVCSAIAWRQDPLVGDDVPTRLLAELSDASAQAPQRVANTYNLGGAALLLGGGPPAVRVAIDGRTDLYGAEVIRTWMEDVVQARPGWESTFDPMRPTAALLRQDEHLGDVLREGRGWVEVDREGIFVLLRDPAAPGWS